MEPVKSLEQVFRELIKEFFELVREFIAGVLITWALWIAPNIIMVMDQAYADKVKKALEELEEKKKKENHITPPPITTKEECEQLQKTLFEIMRNK